MRIESVTAHAFGPFSGQPLEFAPGMNVIYGLNEAGKSSWHAALYAGLCGIRRGRGRDEKPDVLFREHHRPWTERGWRVAIILRLEDGRRVEVDYNLDEKTATVLDADLGRDYASQIVFDGAPDASRWLGLDRKSFIATACVKQADLVAVSESSELLQEYLQRAADTAGVDQTAARALEILEDFHRERIGTTAVNARRPLRLAMNAVAEAERELERAKGRHAAYELLAQHAEVADAQTRDIEKRLRLVEAKIARRDAGIWDGRLARARELHARYSDGPPPSVVGDEELAQQVAGAVTSWKERPSIPSLSGPSAQDLADQLGRLPPEPTGDTEVHASVKAEAQEYRVAVGGLDRHLRDRPVEPVTVSTGGASEIELRDLARELGLSEPLVDPVAQARAEQAKTKLDAVPAQRGSKLRAAIGIVLVLGGLAAIGADLVLPGAALVVAGGIVLLMTWPRGNEAARLKKLEALRTAEGILGNQRHVLEEVLGRRERARQRVEELGLVASPGALIGLADQLAEVNRARERVREWEERRTGLQRDADQARDRVMDALRSRGAETAEDAEAALGAYEGACIQRHQQAEEAGRRPGLGLQIADRTRLEQAAQDAERALAQARSGLRSAAVACGLKGETEQDLLLALEAWQDQRAARIRATETANQEWTELQGLLEGASLEDLEVKAARVQALAEERTQGISEQELEAVVPEDDVEHQLEGLRRERDLAAAERDGLNGRLVDQAVAAKGVPEAEETLAAAQEELQRVRDLAASIELTQRFLLNAQEQVHRRIGPALSSTVKQWLPAVTQGRYHDVQVSPETLQVRVRPAGGTWRDAALLSHGTAEQVYLLLRVALAQQLTMKGEICPLLLDDVTVQSDSERTLAILETLHTLSQERQVILFSQEPEVLQWANTHLVQDQDGVIELLEPAPPV